MLLALTQKTSNAAAVIAFIGIHKVLVKDMGSTGLYKTRNPANIQRKFTSKIVTDGIFAHRKIR